MLRLCCAGLAKANLVSQQFALTEAEATLKRYQILIKSDAISHQELKQQQAKARVVVQAANAEIAQVPAQLDESRHQRKKPKCLPPQTVLLRNAVPKWAS